MMKIKKAQLSQQPVFTDADVRRVFGYAFDILHSQQNQEAIQSLSEIQQNMINENQHITLQELKSTPVWEQLQPVLGEDNWAENPNIGI